MAPNPKLLCHRRLATDGVRPSDRQHAVQRRHADGSFGLLSREPTGAQPWSDQRLGRGSGFALFRLHKACRNRRPAGVGFRWEECPVREAASLPRSSLLGLKRSQAEQGQPVRMTLAGHQLTRALASALGMAAAHETPVV